MKPQRSGHPKTLMDAVLANDVEAVRDHIRDGADVEEMDESGESPLGKAAHLGNAEIVRALLTAGARADFGGVSVPLEDAAGKGHTEVVSALLTAGADVNQKSEGGGTALMMAAFCGHFNIAKILIEAGADGNAVDECAQTAFYFALKKGHQDIVELLTPLTPPSQREQAKILVEQERQRETRLKDPENEKIRQFLIAASVSNISRIRQFLQSGMDVNARGEGSGQSALHKAVSHGHCEMAQFLVGAGAKIDVPDQWREITPLGEAAMRANSDMVRLLINSGANVNFRNSKGETPLLAATWSGDAKVVSLLIDAGADVNARDEIGKTALMEAVSREYDEVANLLIKAGAEWRNLPWNLVKADRQPTVRTFLNRLQGTGES